MQKKFIFIGIGVFLLVGGFIFWLLNPLFSAKRKIAQTDKSMTQKSITLNILPVKERPYITLEPKSSVEPQSLGHWVTVTINEIGDFDKVEYEFEYTNGSMIQGGMGRLDFTQEPTPVIKEIAFGSASKGKYKYDEGVNKGQFTFRFFKGSEEAGLKTDFQLQTRALNDGIFRTADDKARLEVGEGDLMGDDYILVASTLGLPQAIEGKIVSEPYGFYADSAKKLTNSRVIFSDINQDSSVILFWNGEAWEELKTEIIDKEAVAAVNALGTFVLISK